MNIYKEEKEDYKKVLESLATLVVSWENFYNPGRGGSGRDGCQCKNCDDYILEITNLRVLISLLSDKAFDVLRKYDKNSQGYLGKGKIR